MVLYRNPNDEAHGICRAEGVCFPDGTKIDEISKILLETSLIPIKPDNLMTLDAFMLYINSDDEILRMKMQKMHRGSSLFYKSKAGKGITITRHTASLYTGEYKG